MARTGKLRSPNPNAFWETILLTYQLASGTDSGASTGGAWNIFPINTKLLDTAILCTLSGNAFTLPLGTYEVFDANFRVFGENQTNIRVWNVTDSAVVSGLACKGSYGDAATGVESLNQISGRFALTASKQLRIEIYCTSTRALYAWGLPCSVGTEVYGTVGLRKIV